ncbi:pilus assembly PilX family protein [Pseudomonas citronellolis]|uniref:pilus assembly PilX family protein n=1 Tax=Pseudomonas citronellolis TaxID=53408 RepID=UPI0023E3F326|nr:PilX N-terminal domain-containing pilus assembly protein [Pseudomonas citronellolis]MDF3935393.1 PilX N-terminal domain-containing pilus assembly protein [Pseudomonas citronellolis]
MTCTRERGAVLLVALVMLLLMTVLALAGIGNSQLENRLAGNRAEYRRVFNATESGLREVERRLARLRGVEDGQTTSCAGRAQLCVLDLGQVRTETGSGWTWQWASDPASWWKSGSNAVAYQGSDDLTSFSPAPRQHAAYLASDGDGLNLGNIGESRLRTDFYYVNAYASGDAGRAPVLLQTVFARRYAN